MKLFTFSKRSQSMIGIYQVIAQDETSARILLFNDGHSLACNKLAFELETEFRLSVHENKESIPFTLEIENENYEG